MNRKEILEEAEKCICTDRNQQYGEPEDNFAKIALLWKDFLGVEISSADVAMMMILFKIGREMSASNHKVDNFVDIAGYAACAGEICANAPTETKTMAHQSKTSWREIEEKKASLKVGDEIKCTLKNGKKVTFCVAHLNPDGNGRVAFVTKDCVGKHRMNPTDTNEGGWPATEMRKYLNNEIWDLLPDDLKAVIKPRLIKTTSFGLNCRDNRCCRDNLWLLSRMEVFGDQGKEKRGNVQFPLFTTERNRDKNGEDGETCGYWLRSPYSQSSSYFCLVNSNGNSNYYNASNAFGVAFGFLI